MSEVRTLTEGLRVNVTPAQREQLEQIAARDDRSVAAVIRRAIREYLARDQKEE
jgi:predicted transcriptional regulator